MNANHGTPLIIRRMLLGELTLIHEWAEAEGWAPAPCDAPAFWAADPEGFFLGTLAGEPVACVSCVRHGKNFGFLGQYIVRPEYRGRGYGRAVWKAGLSHLSGRNVGLDGVLSQVVNYERSGFQLAHYTTRYEGVGGGELPTGLVPVREIAFEDVLAYDAMCFPALRQAFLWGWLTSPAATGFAAVEGGRIAGYGVVRRCTAGHKIGPLFADDVGVASRLLAGLTAVVTGDRFTIDIPDSCVQQMGDRLVERFALKEVFHTARMYTAGEPAYDHSRVFGVTSLELG